LERKTIKILICDQDRQTAELLQIALREQSYCFQQVEDIEAAIQQLNPGKYHALVLGLHKETSEGKLDGLRAIPILRKIDPILPIITISYNDSLEIERQARMAGIFYYLLQPLDINEAQMSINNAVRKYERLSGNENMAIDFSGDS